MGGEQADPKSAAVTLASQYAELLGAEDADLELHVGSEFKVFRAHSFVLKVRSPYFKAMLASNMVETHSKIIQLSNVSARAFELLLPFLYGGSITAPLDTVADIQEAADLADFLQVDDFLPCMRAQYDVRRILEEQYDTIRKATGPSSEVDAWSAFPDCASDVDAWLASMTRSPALHDDIEEMLVVKAQVGWNKLCVLSRAHLYGFPKLRQACLEMFSTYATYDWESTSAKTADVAFERDFKQSLQYCLANDLVQACPAAVAEASAAIIKSTCTFLDEYFTADEGDGFYLSVTDATSVKSLFKLLHRVSEPMEQVANVLAGKCTANRLSSCSVQVRVSDPPLRDVSDVSSWNTRKAD